MMYAYRELSTLFDTGQPYVNTLVIENSVFFRELVTDISSQINGYEGRGVLSENNKPVTFSKRAEILDRFIPFDINKKSLITRLITVIEQTAVSAEYFERTTELMGRLEGLLEQLASEVSSDIVFPKLSVSSIIKSASPMFRDDYSSLPEKVLDYMELVREFECRKLFFTVNLRCFMGDREAELFMESAVSHDFDIIMLECCEYSRCSMEKRVIIDKDLCEIY